MEMLASVLLLAVCASAPAAAHGIAVDARTLVQAEADEQKRQLEEMRDVNVDARRDALQLQRQIVGLQAEVVDRGLLLTLDDALFAGSSARLNPAGVDRLDLLANFLEDHPYRTAQIESSAACRASAGYDSTLSQRRAAAVARDLLRRGTAPTQLSTRGSHESSSVTGDCDAASLHRNRQVIVVIENVVTSAGEP
jgi:Outer membrane protein and related peptidoglycan-associated (lipo)proteins